ncbi:MAG: alpha/beta hydrolase [Candidatus Rokuibacteriota bacterium]
MSRRHWITLAVYGVVLTAIVAGRGWFLARALGGRYPLAYLLYDVIAFGAILALLRLFDASVKMLARRLVGSEGLARRVVGQATAAGVVIGVGFPFILVTLQFHPLRIATVGTPRQWGLPYTDVTVTADGLRLAAWHVPATREDQPVVVVTHGFNANRENFLPAVHLVHQLGYEAVIVDFRAHGDSEGHTSTFGFREASDIKAAYDWIVMHRPGRPVYAVAYSMGGAAVVHVAARHGIFDKIVLDSTFSSLEHVAHATLLGYFGPLAGPMWRVGRFWGWVWSGVDVGDHEPGRHIRALASQPLLLIHGTGDRFIPHTETLRLHALAGGRAELWLVEGAGHVQTLDHPEYRERLARFFGAPAASANRAAGPASLVRSQG